MKKVLIVQAAVFALACLCSAAPVQAQSGTAAKITFTQQKKEDARQQLKRLLSEYDLDPWIFTQEVRIEAGVDPHSHPILTLNTENLDNDELKLATFLHEQAHWFVSGSIPYRAPKDGEEVAVIQALRQMYPDPPAAVDYGTYAHLIVAWAELDAMVELVGEERARQLVREEVEQSIEEPLSEVDKGYKWYNERVLEEAEEIGTLLAEHDFVITPEKGIVIDASEE